MILMTETEPCWVICPFLSVKDNMKLEGFQKILKLQVVKLHIQMKIQKINLDLVLP